MEYWANLSGDIVMVGVGTAVLTTNVTTSGVDIGCTGTKSCAIVLGIHTNVVLPANFLPGS